MGIENEVTEEGKCELWGLDKGRGVDIDHELWGANACSWLKQRGSSFEKLEASD